MHATYHNAPTYFKGGALYKILNFMHHCVSLYLNSLGIFPPVIFLMLWPHSGLGHASLLHGMWLGYQCMLTPAYVR